MGSGGTHLQWPPGKLFGKKRGQSRIFSNAVLCNAERTENPTLTPFFTEFGKDDI